MIDLGKFIPWDTALRELALAMDFSINSVDGRARLTRYLVAANEHLHAGADLRELSAVFTLRLDQDGRFWAPPGFDTLLAVSIDGKPARLVDKFFEFAPGTAGGWTEVSAVKLGTFAVMRDSEDGPFTLVVSSDRAEEGVLVAMGAYCDGSQVSTRNSRGELLPGAAYRFDSGVAATRADTVFGRVDRLQKRLSEGVVRVYARDESGTDVMLIAEGLPGSEEFPRYARYRVIGLPASCRGWDCVSAKFRMSAPRGPAPYVLSTTLTDLVGVVRASKDLLNAASTQAPMYREAVRAAVRASWETAQLADHSRPTHDIDFGNELFFDA
jgi:hypothetical protein